MRSPRLPLRLGLEGLPHHRRICGIPLPAGLRESDRLPEPVFTPATKAATGHDENISFERAASLIGKELAEKVRAVSLEIYRRAAAYAEPRGVISPTQNSSSAFSTIARVTARPPMT